MISQFTDLKSKMNDFIQSNFDWFRFNEILTDLCLESDEACLLSNLKSWMVKYREVSSNISRDDKIGVQKHKCELFKSCYRELSARVVSFTNGAQATAATAAACTPVTPRYGVSVADRFNPWVVSTTERAVTLLSLLPTWCLESNWVDAPIQDRLTSTCKIDRSRN